MGTLESISSVLDSSAVYAALISAIAGGSVKLLRLWVPDEGQFGRRIELLSESAHERMNRRLQDLLTAALSDLAPEDLRGAPPVKPDFVAEYGREQSRVFSLLNRLARMRKCLQRTNGFLLVGWLASLVLLALAFVLKDYKYIVGVVGVAAIMVLVFQLVAVWIMRDLNSDLRTLEREK